MRSTPPGSASVIDASSLLGAARCRSRLHARRGCWNAFAQVSRVARSAQKRKPRADLRSAESVAPAHPRSPNCSPPRAPPRRPAPSRPAIRRVRRERWTRACALPADGQRPSRQPLRASRPGFWAAAAASPRRRRSRADSVTLVLDAATKADFPSTGERELDERLSRAMSLHQGSSDRWRGADYFFACRTPPAQSPGTMTVRGVSPRAATRVLSLMLVGVWHPRAVGVRGRLGRRVRRTQGWQELVRRRPIK